MVRRGHSYWAVLFWALALYALAGVASGVALGREWLAAANRAGVEHWPQIGIGWCLLCAAVLIRLSLIKRSKVDAVGGFFALISFAAIMGAATFGGVGLLGRWPESLVLWVVHVVLMVLACSSGALAAIATARVGLASQLPVFRIPAALMSFGIVLALALSLVDLWEPLLDSSPIFGRLSKGALVVISFAAIRVAFLAPHKERTQRCQRQTTLS